MRRNHLVPRSYLERWVEGGKVHVRRRDGKTFDAGPRDVAVETDFYDMPDGAGGVSKWIEVGLQDIEGTAASVLRKIDASGRLPGPRDTDSAVLAMFVGLQVARTTSHREKAMFPRRVLDWLGGRAPSPELVATFLETRWYGHRPHEGAVDAAFTMVDVAQRTASETLTEAWANQFMLNAALEVSTRLLAYEWSLERDPRRQFIASDAPVVLWRTPSREDHYRGIGIETAEQVRFPLDPGQQFVMSRKRPRNEVAEVSPHRVRQCNIDMAGACHRFVVGSPSQSQMIDDLPLDEWRPLLRFNTAPLLVDGPNGPEPGEGDVVHFWTPRNSAAGRPVVTSGRRA